MSPRHALLPLAVAATLVAPAGALAAKAPLKAPGGTAFYTPPASALKGVHGTLIWSRKAPGAVKLPSASQSTNVLYRSTGVDGKAIAVSGTVDIPRGKAPKGGWPMISWAHGTTGIADVCAPSRDAASSPAHGYIAYAYPTLDKFLKAGYAVLRTDYAGLGTAGSHPYLIGRSEGRSVIDIARAARALDPRVGRTWAIAGHSQGGHAALWAAADAKRWAPELTMRGVVAFAPASHILDEVKLAKSLTSPSGLSGLGSLLVTGAAAADPKIDLQKLLTPEAAALVPQVEQKCLGQLSAPDSWGALAPAQIVRDDADTTELYATLAANDPGTLHFTSPVEIVQGDKDTTVFPSFTDALVKQLKASGASLTYDVLPGVQHGPVVEKGATKALAFFKKRLR